MVTFFQRDGGWRRRLTAVTLCLLGAIAGKQHRVVRLHGHGETQIRQRVFVPAIDLRLLRKAGLPVQRLRHIRHGIKHPAATAGKQAVSGKDPSVLLVPKRQMAPGVPGNGHHGQIGTQGTKCHAVPIDE